ncbi:MULTISPECIES: BTAD domain-containing putative transcriptional regulator [unclassified Streptomyces]|uniref:BTAD domain-containing putative transcriptional regulator n=1 Tax=unclassified Streptomyces TaxID=2593676 RepID=UPI0037A16B83
MRFGVLGPLEVTSDAGPVPLGGVKQRALLGYLLLNANRVVATSQLLDALWTDGELPLSARKILQNAVSGIRTVLATHGTGSPGEGILVTQAPGYMLSLEGDRVDARRFQRLASEGRTRLAAGRPVEAASLLGEALSLWRGPVLADLSDAGIDWPELDVIENTRLDALEDYFEAEIACGRHQQILSQLGEVASGDNLRERACGQLMVALYRSGRQVDALEFYGRVRTTLTQEFGLEPGRDLQELQQAILTHDPTLVREQPEQAALMTGGPSGSPPAGAPAGSAGTAADPGQGAREQPEGECAVRAPAVSVLAVRWHPRSPEWAVADDQHLRERLGTEVLNFGGAVADEQIPGLVLARFTALRGVEDCAQRAVFAAQGLRSTLRSAGPQADGGRPRLSACVLTVEGDVPGSGRGGLSVDTELARACERMLDAVPSGETHVCRSTRRAAGTAATYFSVGGREPVWRLGDVAAGSVVLERETELDLLWTLMEHVGKRSQPHLVTVLGDPGVGKTQMAMAFEESLRQWRADVEFLMGGFRPASESSGPMAVPAGVLASYCGEPRPGEGPEGPEGALARLRKAVARTVADEDVDELVGLLAPLLSESREGTVPVADVLAAWQTLLESIADDHPVIVVMDNLEDAGEEVLDCIEALADTATAKPLLLIGLARSELLDRRPTWGGGRRRASMIHLNPLSDAAIDSLWSVVLASMDSGLKECVHHFLDVLPPGLRASPCVRRSYIRMSLLLTPWRRTRDSPLRPRRSAAYEIHPGMLQMPG